MATSAGAGMPRMRLYRDDKPIRQRGRGRFLNPIQIIRKGLAREAAKRAARQKAVDSRQ